jgi:hypothetical protein
MAGVQSPETCIGAERAERFASAGCEVRNVRRSHVLPARSALNQWGLVGDWTVLAERAVDAGLRDRPGDSSGCAPRSTGKRRQHGQAGQHQHRRRRFGDGRYRRR